MTRNKNETPEQREKRLEKQKLYYLKRKAAGTTNQRDEKVFKQQNKVIRRKHYEIANIEIEHEIFDKTQLKIPIPPSVKSKLLEKKELSLENGKIEIDHDLFQENTNETGNFESDKRNNNDNVDIIEDDEDDDPSSVVCDVCRKRCVNDQYTSFRMNELSETLKILLPDDLYDDILLKLCPCCKLNVNKSCLF